MTGDRVSLRRFIVGQLIRTEDCWTLRCGRDERPRLRVGGRQRLLTHCVWWVTYGCWPAVTQDRGIVHMCGNPRCFRPRHLGLLTRAEWMRLRADLLEQSSERECRLCDRIMRVPRSDAHRRVYCSRRCRDLARWGKAA